MLKTDLDSGIADDDVELSKRKNMFGANTYPMKKGRSFLVLILSELIFIELISVRRSEM